jgi:hypothetical protein
MKKSILITFLAISIAFTFSACSNSTTTTPAVNSNSGEKVTYTCSMHPEVQADKPGDCPKCGMALVKMESADTTQNNSDTMQMH